MVRECAVPLEWLMYVLRVTIAEASAAHVVVRRLAVEGCCLVGFVVRVLGLRCMRLALWQSLRFLR